MLIMIRSKRFSQVWVTNVLGGSYRKWMRTQYGNKTVVDGYLINQQEYSTKVIKCQ